MKDKFFMSKPKYSTWYLVVIFCAWFATLINPVPIIVILSWIGMMFADEAQSQYEKLNPNSK